MRSIRLLTFLLDLSIAHFCFRFWSSLWISESGSSGDVPSFSITSEIMFVFFYFWLLVSIDTVADARSPSGHRFGRK